jgi:hypothetical protein
MTRERTNTWHLKSLDPFSHLRKDGYKMVDKHNPAL